MSATEQRAELTFCVLLHKSSSKETGMLEEECGKAEMKRTPVYASILQFDLPPERKPLAIIW
jgi:hypothetical protein